MRPSSGIRQVADEVGLSMATVSRALRGRPGVSESNRRRVEEAAARLGYVASSTAVGLATGRTRTVAVVVPHVTRWYFATVIHGAEQVLREHGYDLMLFNLAGDAEARRRVMRTQTTLRRADAVLVLGLLPSTEEREWFDRHGARVVLVGALTDSWPGVSIDDEHVAVLATRHLLELGHERIAYVGGTAEQALDFSTPGARRKGFHDCLAHAGLEVDPAYDRFGDFTVASGREQGLALLALPEPPTAVFCASDEMAIGLLRAAHERGIAVPDQLSVVGVDDHELAEYVGLTTVRQPVEQLGRVAALQILEALEGPETLVDVDLPARHVELDVDLVVRGSTAPLATGGR